MASGRTMLDLFTRCLSVGAAGLCVAGLVVVLVPQLREAATQRLSARPDPLAVGDVLGIAPAIYDANEFTAILFATASCTACERAKPYFRALRTELEARRGLGFVIMPTEPLSASELAYAQAIGVAPENVLPVPTAVRRQLSTVPALAIVDRSGAVRFVYAGFGTAADASDAAERIGKRLGL